MRRRTVVVLIAAATALGACSSGRGPRDDGVGGGDGSQVRRSRGLRRTPSVRRRRAWRGPHHALAVRAGGRTSTASRRLSGATFTGHGVTVDVLAPRRRPHRSHRRSGRIRSGHPPDRRHTFGRSSRCSQCRRGRLRARAGSCAPRHRLGLSAQAPGRAALVPFPQSPHFRARWITAIRSHADRPRPDVELPARVECHSTGHRQGFSRAAAAGLCIARRGPRSTSRA